MKVMVNEQVKALRKQINADAKVNEIVRFEKDITFNSNTRTQNVFSGEEIRTFFDRTGDTAGATKCCHLKVPCMDVPGKVKDGYTLSGERFTHIVVKRFSEWGWCPEDEGSGNQLIDEVRCWQKFANMPESDYLNPVLRAGWQQGDKVSPTDECVLDTCYIIAQRAIEVGRMREMCDLAEQMNADHSIFAQSADDRYNELCKFADKQGWRDVKRNPGNCGVIYDYFRECYKCVIIDYAL